MYDCLDARISNVYECNEIRYSFFFFQILSVRVYDAPVSYAPKTKKKKGVECANAALAPSSVLNFQNQG